MRLPPGPRGLATLGFFGGGTAAGMLAFLTATARRYGPITGFRLLGKTIVVVNEPQLIEEILVKRQHEFTRDTGATLLRELVGDGLLTREEPQHRERRRMLQPAFHRTQIASYAASMTREAARTAEAWSTESSVDIGTEMKRLTLTVVGAALFGADLHERAADVAGVLQRVIAKTGRLAPLFAYLEPLAKAYRRALPGGPSLVFRAERRELDALVGPITAARRTRGERDILSLLLDESLDDADVTNEIVTLVLAGHETTSTALTWTWYLLATHPAVAERLYAELDTVLGDRDPGLDDVAQLPYANAVFTEALRLYPPALAFGRRPLHTCELGGFTIPAGASIFVSPYITQRDARWFADPEAFRPERWFGEAPPKFAYFPFGGGAKMCIGDSFAKLEGVIVLATLARRYRLALVDPQAVGIAPGATLRPDRPILMRPVPRERTAIVANASHGEAS